MHKEKTVGNKLPRVATVTMVKQPGPLLGSFIEYHLAIGFDHLFLFFDDPNDPSIAEAQQYCNVTVVKNDKELQRKWEEKEIYARIGHTIHSEMMVRQQLCVEVALDLARQKSFDWLLHIDIDELFYSPTCSVKEHFRRLENKGIDQSLYINYEAIPETADIRNPFKEVTLFKKNPAALSHGKVSIKQQKLINLCPHLMSGRFFFYYIDRKAAVKLKDGVRTNGPHMFHSPRQSGLMSQLLNTVAKTRIARLAINARSNFIRFMALRSYPYFPMRSKEAFILHYPACGFEQFWARYIAWGNFTDSVWGGKGSWVDIVGSFHLESRDVVMQGDRNLAREFYESRYVMSDEEELRQLIDADLVCRIESPALLLRKIETEENRYQLTAYSVFGLNDQETA
jgi:Glycosyl transferase family 2